MKNIENKNVEITPWSPGKSKEWVPSKLKFWDKETKDTSKEEQQLAAAYENEKKIAPALAKVPKDINKAVANLNRPEAKEGLIQAYQDTEKTIQDSPKDANLIASTAGTIMNRILNA